MSLLWGVEYPCCVVAGMQVRVRRSRERQRLMAWLLVRGWSQSSAWPSGEGAVSVMPVARHTCVGRPETTPTAHPICSCVSQRISLSVGAGGGV